jgi:hypothetical protein
VRARSARSDAPPKKLAGSTAGLPAPSTLTKWNPYASNCSSWPFAAATPTIA